MPLLEQTLEKNAPSRADSGEKMLLLEQAL